MRVFVRMLVRMLVQLLMRMLVLVPTRLLMRLLSTGLRYVAIAAWGGGAACQNAAIPIIVRPLGNGVHFMPPPPPPPRHAFAYPSRSLRLSFFCCCLFGLLAVLTFWARGVTRHPLHTAITLCR